MASLVDYLSSQKQDSSFSARTKLATQYGIKGYTGTAAQNTQLLGLLQKPVAGPVAPVAPKTSLLSGSVGTGTGNVTKPTSPLSTSQATATGNINQPSGTGVLSGSIAKPQSVIQTSTPVASIPSSPMSYIGSQVAKTPTIPTEIPSDLLQRTAPVTLPAYKEPAMPSLSEYLKNTNLSAPNEYSAVNDDISNQILSGVEKMGTKGAAKARYEEQYGLPGYQQQLNEVNAQMNALAAEAMGKQLDAQGKPIANTFINRQVDAIEREKTVKALGLSAISQALQGNISLANESVTRALDAEFSPIENRIQYLKTALEMNQDNMDRAEKRRAEELQIKIKEWETTVANQKSQKQNIYEVMTKAAQSGADSATLNKIMSAKSAEEAVVNAGSYLRSGQNQVLGSATTGYYEKQPDGSYRQVVPGENGNTNVNSVNNISAFMEGIAKMESGGNYKAIGQATSTGDKAYGKYQVMGANIPSWTKAALGQSLTIQQFLNSPEAQDATAQYKMQESFNRYGNWEDVASVWFSGRPLSQAGNAKDVIGTTVPKYVQTVMAGMRQAGGSGSQLTQTQIKSIESSAEYKKINALSDLQNKINTYRDAVNKTDKFAVYGANKATLDSMYADLKIAYKEAANLGALTGPDVLILQEAIKPMSGITNYTSYVTSGSKQGVLNSIDTALNTVSTAAQRPLSLLNSKYSGYINDPYFQTVTSPFSGSGYAPNGYVSGSSQALAQYDSNSMSQYE